MLFEVVCFHFFVSLVFGFFILRVNSLFRLHIIDIMRHFTLIELLVVIAQFLCDFAEKAITVFADAKNVITRKFLERIEGVRGDRKSVV